MMCPCVITCLHLYNTGAILKIYLYKTRNDLESTGCLWHCHPSSHSWNHNTELLQGSERRSAPKHCSCVENTSCFSRSIIIVLHHIEVLSGQMQGSLTTGNVLLLAKQHHEMSACQSQRLNVTSWCNLVSKCVRHCGKLSHQAQQFKTWWYISDTDKLFIINHWLIHGRKMCSALPWQHLECLEKLINLQ